MKISPAEFHVVATESGQNRILGLSFVSKRLGIDDLTTLSLRACVQMTEMMKLVQLVILALDGWYGEWSSSYGQLETSNKLCK